MTLRCSRCKLGVDGTDNPIGFVDSSSAISPPVVGRATFTNSRDIFR